MKMFVAENVEEPENFVAIAFCYLFVPLINEITEQNAKRCSLFNVQQFLHPKKPGTEVLP